MAGGFLGGLRDVHEEVDVMPVAVNASRASSHTEPFEAIRAHPESPEDGPSTDD